MAKSKLPLILIAGGASLALIVLAFILMSKSGGSDVAVEDTTVVQMQPTDPAPSAEPTPEATRRSTARGGAVFGTSVRDPFTPLATPEASDGSSAADTKTKSSNPVKATKSSDKVSGGTTKGSQSTPSKGTSKDSGSTDSGSKDSGSKAPQPIGGPKTEGDTPTAQIEVSVLQVQDSMAIVRINGTRTTLYLNVADPTGVTYVSSLGGGCGWFGTGDLTQRYTICEGDSRSLS